MSVDMGPDAVAARLAAARPPDLLPEHRLWHKVDMTPDGIDRRLRQVESLRRLEVYLSRIGGAMKAAAERRS